MTRTVLTLAFLSCAATGALAANPQGVWRVQDGSGNVNIRHCGRALCGYAGKEVVLQRMSPRGPNEWQGTMIDIRGGGVQYDGSMSLIDANTLRVRGCMQGGGMCGDQTWTRAR